MKIEALVMPGQVHQYDDEQLVGQERTHFDEEQQMWFLGEVPDDHVGCRSPEAYLQKVEERWKIPDVQERLVESVPSEVWWREKVREQRNQAEP